MLYFIFVFCGAANDNFTVLNIFSGHYVCMVVCKHFALTKSCVPSSDASSTCFINLNLMTPQHLYFSSFSFTSSSNVSSVFSDFSSASLLSLYTCAMNYSPIICVWQTLFARPICTAVWLYCQSKTCTHPGFSNPAVDNLHFVSATLFLARNVVHTLSLAQLYYCTLVL